ncbi:hypothetical protein MSG28_012774 [Choristoneura fumiferana]|uniref:Uncharacterized protein n=1 Tax=Choristoneura fumiferana TaxID=7141 RepID=A0ACC0JI05_CHOFU|nr:hypothetical protein MSG28_012774 [Choristoneura fumiferana]
MDSIIDICKMRLTEPSIQQRDRERERERKQAVESPTTRGASAVDAHRRLGGLDPYVMPLTPMGDCSAEACVPCPAMDPCAPSAGIKSGLRDGKPIDGKQENPCPCRTCCCGKPPVVTPCYKQPRIPESYAPRRCYMKPSAPVENCTTYKMSYLPVDDCKNLRGQARKPVPNLVPSCEPMEGCTVQKLSFLPNPVCVTQSIRPCHHDMWGQGPMQNITTQRHDYVPKPSVLRESFKPPSKFHSVEQPFERCPTNGVTNTHNIHYAEYPTHRDYSIRKKQTVLYIKKPGKCESDSRTEDRTVNKLSYLPPERQAPVKSYAPDRCYEKPAAKMDSSTTHKMSFMPNQVSMDGGVCFPSDDPHTQLMPKEPVPWACKGQYQKPCQKLDTNTTYTMSYLTADADCRRRAIIPDSCTNPVTASKRFETQTIYKNSYLPATAPIPQPVKPVPNIVPSTALMDGDTVQKLSFLPNPVCVTQAIRPCHHDMWGQGPMQNITTQRHDFVPKPSCLRESFKPPAKFHSIEQPFENRTVNRLSFLDPGRAPPLQSYAPNKCYEKPTAKMESATTQKMSYQPVCVPSPQRPPWACKGQYQKPCQKKSASEAQNTHRTYSGRVRRACLRGCIMNITPTGGSRWVVRAEKGIGVEGTTVYRSSFLPPGEDCSQVMDPCAYGDCKPCECICPAECIATDPCACDFPRAACCG